VLSHRSSPIRSAGVRAVTELLIAHVNARESECENEGEKNDSKANTGYNGSGVSNDDSGVVVVAGGFVDGNSLETALMRPLYRLFVSTRASDDTRDEILSGVHRLLNVSGKSLRFGL
jgi:hypothetical protein